MAAPFYLSIHLYVYVWIYVRENIRREMIVAIDFSAAGALITGRCASSLSSPSQSSRSSFVRRERSLWRVSLRARVSGRGSRCEPRYMRTAEHSSIYLMAFACLMEFQLITLAHDGPEILLALPFSRSPPFSFPVRRLQSHNLLDIAIFKIETSFFSYGKFNRNSGNIIQSISTIS